MLVVDLLGWIVPAFFFFPVVLTVLFAGGFWLALWLDDRAEEKALEKQEGKK